MHLSQLKRGNMSQIFDALQRSETERNGKDPAVPSATELLPRTESFAADSPMDRPRNSWTATAVAEPGLDAAELTQGPLPGLSVNLFTAKSVKPVEAQSEGFKQCEVLSISPSLRATSFVFRTAKATQTKLFISLVYVYVTCAASDR